MARFNGVWKTPVSHSWPHIILRKLERFSNLSTLCFNVCCASLATTANCCMPAWSRESIRCSQHAAVRPHNSWQSNCHANASDKKSQFHAIPFYTLTLNSGQSLFAFCIARFVQDCGEFPPTHLFVVANRFLRCEWKQTLMMYIIYEPAVCSNWIANWIAAHLFNFAFLVLFCVCFCMLNCPLLLRYYVCSMFVHQSLTALTQIWKRLACMHFISKWDLLHNKD